MWTQLVSYRHSSSRSQRFDLNYVGCEPKFEENQSINAKGVWSELCGMWTNDLRSSTLKRSSVWSELCGMWTKMECWLSFSMALFDLNYVGCEHGRPSASRVFKTSLIWTMWDVNFAPLQQQFTTWTGVWSELCGMWTSNFFTSCLL